MKQDTGAATAEREGEGEPSEAWSGKVKQMLQHPIVGFKHLVLLFNISCFIDDIIKSAEMWNEMAYIKVFLGDWLLINVPLYILTVSSIIDVQGDLYCLSVLSFALLLFLLCLKLPRLHLFMISQSLRWQGICLSWFLSAVDHMSTQQELLWGEWQPCQKIECSISLLCKEPLKPALSWAKAAPVQSKLSNFIVLYCNTYYTGICLLTSREGESQELLLSQLVQLD